MTDKTLIGQRIKTLRKDHGYSVEEFARLIGISPRFVYDIECGRTGVSLDKLIKIKELFGTSVDYILFGDAPVREPISSDLIELINECPEEKDIWLNEIIKAFILSIK